MHTHCVFRGLLLPALAAIALPLLAAIALPMVFAAHDTGAAAAPSEHIVVAVAPSAREALAPDAATPFPAPRSVDMAEEVSVLSVRPPAE